MIDEVSRPGIGVGVFIYRNGKFLFGKRTNSHGEGTYAPPGGHLEFGETPEECAIREVREETGLIIQKLKRGPYTNDIFLDEKKHYITLMLLAKYETGEALILEPDKCLEWKWFEWRDLPQNLFLPIRNLIQEGWSPSEQQFNF